MRYKNNNFSSNNFFLFFISVIPLSALTGSIFPGFFGSLFFLLLCTFLILAFFIVLCTILVLYLDKTIVVSKKLLLIVSFITVFFLFANIILFLVKGLAHFTILELLTAPFPIANVFYTLDGLNFPKLKYITLFNCLIKSFLFLLVSILILILNMLLNSKSTLSLNLDSIHTFLIISNLALIFHLKSSFLYYFLRSFGFTFHRLSCEILIHNYTFYVFFFGIFLYLIITLFLVLLPLTSGVNKALVLVKELSLFGFIYFMSYFYEYTMVQTMSYNVFFNYRLLRAFLTDEIYSFPLNIILF